MLNAEQALRKVGSLHERLAGRSHKIGEFDDFYEGKQPLRFASREWADFHKDRYTGFADNWCGVVPDALNERLRVVSIQADKKRSQEEEALYRAWEDNDLAAQSSQGFLESAVAKRSHVLVWGTSDDAPEVTWEHPSTTIVEHSATNSTKRMFGLKTWIDDGREYAVLYEPDAVWKFTRKVAEVVVRNGVTAGGIHVGGTSTRSVDYGAKWEQWQPSSDDTWPIANPFGKVPLVEIPNRPRLARGPISDIQGPIDIKELQHGRLLWLTGQDTKIGQWDSAKLDVFTNVIEIAVGHISSQSRVPAHYFVANSGLSNINGETLTATETPLVKKVEEFQLFTSGRLAEVASLMADAQGNYGLAASIRPSSIKWANPAIRSEAQLEDALSKKHARGYPFEYLMELEGIAPDDRERILEMKKREQSDPDVAAIVDRLGNASAFGG